MEQERKREKKGMLAWLASYKYVLLVVAAGVICLLWPGQTEEVEFPIQPEEIVSADLETVRTEMETILGKIQGVGQLHLMLTVDTGAERVLAGDTSLSYSGNTAAPDDYSRTSETVLVSGDSGDEVVVTREIWPKFRGALVVCQGADDPTVQLAVMEAVSALTGLGSDRISVLKGQ